ncbi:MULTISPECIES: zinc-dependent metalloprotease [Actinoalloteichus]|uniref:Hydrolase n=1 Tax=Actinoalloteichus fjordicus TaxID=1612552 RepID=A0AAC9PQQ5_9PSEU|nr:MULTISPECIES: zinc-dependent metalloprotease [Actinoalloteichus]APU13056.1 putative hydrolase [Actinoalloteichus fjordicus]APU19029.1 putative hydrolase [Actinoalloteichus sp. GBA129-24]
MTDLPFGFNPPDPEDRGDRNKPSERPDGNSGANPFGFAGGMPPGMPPGGMPPGMPPGGMPPGFDMNQLGQMFSQLGQMFSQASQGGGGPVNYDLAKQLAFQHLDSQGRRETPTSAQRTAASDAVRLAELWLDESTTLPVGARLVEVWSAKQWVEQTLPTWQRLCDPVVQRISSAWVETLPDEAKQAAGPLLNMLGQMGGMAYGSQLGGALGQLGAEVLSATEIGLPLGKEGVAALLPANIERFTGGLERPAHEVLVFLAAREAAHHRLFTHVSWLRQGLFGAVEEFSQGIRVDVSAMEDLATKIDPSNPASLEEAMRSGLLEPERTPAQEQALVRLETLLALVEGWIDVVVGDAVGERLPGADALRETLRRRRASGGPAEQTFATLVGLDLRPRQLRAAATLWRGLSDRHGKEARDALWDHPDLLPTAEDLTEPVEFVERFGAHRGELDDPLAALEAARRKKESESGSSSDAGGSGAGGSSAGSSEGDTPRSRPDSEDDSDK